MCDVIGVRKGTLLPGYQGPRPQPVGEKSANQPLPPLAGGVRGALAGGWCSSPVEALPAGAWVLSHAGILCRVQRIICQPYCGRMIGLHHARASTALWLTGKSRVLCRQRILSYGLGRPWGAVPIGHFVRARELRREMTPEERMLWARLEGKRLGVKFRRQHPLGPYFADFYAREPALVVELDGDVHRTPEARAYDEERTTYLEALGLDVIRFDDAEVTGRLEGVLAKIQLAAQRVYPADQPLQQWRQAETLRPGDIVYSGVEREPGEVIAVERKDTVEDVYDLQMEGQSFLTTVCAVLREGSLGEPCARA